jgi:8-oxo-dGTP diphosphatase
MERINVRVYGLFINASNEILLTDEYRLNTYMTKFPGGGLEIGEGVLDCLKRECLEELQQEIKIERHFYTTEFFQPTKLLPDPQQLMSIYYLIHIQEPFRFPITSKKFDFPAVEGKQSFRFVPLKEITEEEVTFPIDKVVIKKLLSEYTPAQSSG